MSLFAVDYLLPKIVTAQRRRAPTFILLATWGGYRRGLNVLNDWNVWNGSAQRDYRVSAGGGVSLISFSISVISTGLVK
jgi:hypothetical protein